VRNQGSLPSESRHAELLEYLLTGETPSFDARRLKRSAELLAADVARNRDDLKIELKGRVEIPGTGEVIAPIEITRTDGASFIVVVAGPLEIDYPTDAVAKALGGKKAGGTLIAINELMIRGNFPAATDTVLTRVLT
jgi:hypothetical protein